MDEAFEAEALELPEDDDETTCAPAAPPASRDYELSRGAIRALALGASTNKARPVLGLVKLTGDHTGHASDGHMAVLVEPASDDDTGEPGAPIHVAAEEILRLKSDKARTEDIASVRLRGDSVRVSVPTEVQVEGTEARRRIDILAVTEEWAAEEYPDVLSVVEDATATPRIICTFSVDLMERAVKVAKEIGAGYVEITRRADGDTSSPLVMELGPRGKHERVRVVAMPMRSSGEVEEKPVPPSSQSIIPGTEERPDSLTEFGRRESVRLINGCTSLRALERWYDFEAARGEDVREPVIAALTERITALGGTA